MRYVWSGIIFPSEVAGYNWNPLIAPYFWRTFFFILLHIEMKREEAKEACVVIGDKYSSKIAKLTLYIHLNPNGGNCHESEAKPTIFCLHKTET